ncbi:MAG TPA: hypothetical protein VFF94_08910 [Novosphingobium sp.]|nr:hypothetical protein [Novosphingobium sp.]
MVASVDPELREVTSNPLPYYPADRAIQSGPCFFNFYRSALLGASRLSVKKPQPRLNSAHDISIITLRDDEG